MNLSPDDVAIRVAVRADLDALTALDHECFDELERWSHRAWRGEVESDALVLVATADQQIVAAASFHVAGEAAELFSVMTAPPWRGVGVATLLLARGFAWAVSRGATQMLLEVRVGNQAQGLYADLGFKPLYQRTNYYGPGLDAVVMARELNGGTDE